MKKACAKAKLLLSELTRYLEFCFRYLLRVTHSVIGSRIPKAFSVLPALTVMQPWLQE